MYVLQNLVEVDLAYSSVAAGCEDTAPTDDYLALAQHSCDTTRNTFATSTEEPPPGVVVEPYPDEHLMAGHLGKGTVLTWIDDVIMTSGGSDVGYGLEGHAELIRTVLARMTAAGMTLKGSKIDLLHKKLSTHVERGVE